MSEVSEALDPAQHAAAVTMDVVSFPSGGKAVLIQGTFPQDFQIQLFPSASNELGISVAAEVDPAAGRLVNLTHDLNLQLGPDDTLAISDAGLLTASAKQSGPKALNLHIGLSLQLPIECVACVRKGIKLARDLAESFQ